MTINIDSARAVDLLHTVSDADRRKMVGQKFGDHLQLRGHTGVDLITNVGELLTPEQKEKLAEHAVPHSVYEGRMPGMSLALAPQWETRVRMSESLLPAEADFWANFADRAGIQLPTYTSTAEPILERSFVYPFYPSPTMEDTYGDRTFPSAHRYNNKAYMKKLTRDLGTQDDVVPGTEVIYTGQSVIVFAAKLEEAVRDYAAKMPEGVWLKHARAANGLSARRFTEERLTAPGGRDAFHSFVRSIFQGEDGQMQPDDVVVEMHRPFGIDTKGFDDYNVRGWLTPDGLYVPFSVGKSINDEKGIYWGMVMARSNDPDQLATIGIHPQTVDRAVDLIEGVASKMHGDGYFGDVSVDFFSRQQQASPAELRDFNQRMGGTTVSGTVNSHAEQVWGESTALIDIELFASSGRRLDEDQLNGVALAMLGESVVPYATTFLRHPKRNQERSGWDYTVKVMAPYPKGASALTKTQIEDTANTVTDQINSAVDVQGLRFRVPNLT